MATTQANFRIDAQHKTLGDLALRESGATPSQIVRETWGYLARNRYKPNAVRKLLDFLTHDASIDKSADDIYAHPPASGKRMSEAEQAVLAGPQLIQQFYSNFGIDSQLAPTRSIEDMKLDAYAEKYPGLRGA